jgi:hypothetical protein
MDIGGFDTSLTSTHWQLVDFGFRAYLWGEQISATQLIRLSYDGEPPPEDSTADESYRRFYLKNLAPIFQGDHASLPLRRFFPYVWRVGGDLFTAWDEFLKTRHWLKGYQYRFRSDVRAIIELWENVGEPTDIEHLRGEDLGMKHREKNTVPEASMPAANEPATTALATATAASVPAASMPATITPALSVTAQSGHEERKV